MIQGLLICGNCGISYDVTEKPMKGVELNFNLVAIFKDTTMRPCTNCNQISWIIQVRETSHNPFPEFYKQAAQISPEQRHLLAQRMSGAHKRGWINEESSQEPEIAEGE